METMHIEGVKMRKGLGVLSAGLIGLVLTTGVILASTSVHADNDTVIDQINVTISVSCTMGGVGMNSHTANMQNDQYSGESGGTYENGIGKTTLTVFCNDYNGFSIYAIGFTGDSYDSANHTKMVGANTNQTISTAVYSSGDSTSSWAMKVDKVTDGTIAYVPANMSIQNSFNNWHVIPDSYTKVAQYHANTGSSATDTVLGGKVETTYAAYVSPVQPADTYVGKVKYTLVHPYDEELLQPQIATSGCINYFPNGSNVVGTMGCQSISSTDTTKTLLASNFSRIGYGFAGWSNKFDYATNPNQAGIKFYGPQEDITFTAGQYTGSNNGLSLYAVWVPNAGSLQDSSKVSELCGAGANALTTAPTDGTANLSSVSALTDQRDNQTYAIAKLADGKCWMIENLRLEAENTRTAEKQALAQGYGTSTTYGNFSGLADAESTGFSSTYSANSLYSNDGSNDTINIGTSNYPAYRMPRYNNTNTSSRASSPTGNGTSMYSYGNYYTWHAAIADLTYNGTNNSSVTNTSLCPSGWHLPTGGRAYASGNTGGVNVTGDTSTFREFYNLGYKTMDEVKTAYEDTPNNGTSYYSSNTTNTAGNTATKAFRSFPNNFLYSGYFATSSADNRGSYGYYWSSTVYDYLSSYRLSLYSSSVRPGTNNYSKYYGLSIRCTVSAGT